MCQNIFFLFTDCSETTNTTYLSGFVSCRFKIYFCVTLFVVANIILFIVTLFCVILSTVSFFTLLRWVMLGIDERPGREKTKKSKKSSSKKRRKDPADDSDDDDDDDDDAMRRSLRKDRMVPSHPVTEVRTSCGSPLGLFLTQIRYSK